METAVSGYIQAYSAAWGGGPSARLMSAACQGMPGELKKKSNCTHRR